jgi:hypothetical protein
MTRTGTGDRGRKKKVETLIELAMMQIEKAIPYATDDELNKFIEDCKRISSKDKSQ